MMFCPECGAENRNDAVFCENCGADISKAFTEAQSSAVKQENQPQSFENDRQEQFFSAVQLQNAAPVQAAAVRVKKPLKTSVKVLIGVVLALVVLIVVFYNVALRMFSPEKAAENYFSTLRAGDWSGAYSHLNVTESEFINQANFVKLMKKNQTPKIVNYSVVKDKAPASSKKSADGGLTKTVTIQYTVQNNSQPQELNVPLIRQPEKQFLFFDTWKVSSADYITPELTVTAPDWASVTLDNIKIDEKYKDEKASKENTSSGTSGGAEQTVTYKLTNLFTGSYTLKAVSPYTEDYSEQVSVGAENNTVSVGNLELKQSTLEEVAKLPGQAIQNIYKAALEGKDFSSVSGYFCPDSDTQNRAESVYKNVLDSMNKGTDGGFKSLSFSNLSSKASGSPENLSILTETDFNYSFTAAYPVYYGGEAQQEYSGSNSGDISVLYRLSDGKWLISQIDGLTLSRYTY